MVILNTEINEADRPVSAVCDDTNLTVELADGRQIVTPLWWYPRLLAASPEQRANVELSRFAVHWEEIDEDLSVDGMLRGAKAPGAKPPEEAA
ncbi:MAG: DUF2442 domain-containing protein [Rhodobacter sp.]|nr:DUF2442 domain-containing protein [Rhodobacter sp.]